MNWDGLSANSFWHDSPRILFNKGCRSMVDLPNESVQMCVTSPPYWGLRKYAGLPDLIWGGDNNCEHKWGELRKTIKHHSGETNPGLEAHFKDAGANDDLGSSFCSLCGAWKGQLGLEPTPEMYIDHLVEIFREVRRVLRRDGVCFVNCGDSYFGGGNNGGNNSPISEKQASNFGAVGQCAEHQKNIGKHPILKPKDLCLIPFRLAIALQEDSWWVRSVIIWNKPNPMPESVTDRPTESHEYILMLTKSARYYYDQEAVREEYTESLDRWGGGNMRKSSHKYIDSFDETGDNGGIGKIGATSMFREGRPVRPNGSGRNRRSVWTFPTQPYPEAHFATYPEKLVEICVKAATPEVGCCSKCGKPWVRIINNPFSANQDKPLRGRHYTDASGKGEHGAVATWSGQEFNQWRAENPIQTLGWQPQCKCHNTDKVPSIVLDPFAGSGTTLKVAAELNRRAIGYELSEQYCQLAVERNKQGIIL